MTIRQRLREWREKRRLVKTAARAIDPASGLPFLRLNLMQRALLSLLDRFGRAFLDKWIVRRLMAATIAAGAVIGAEESDAKGAAAFLTAACVFAFDWAQAAIRRRWITPKPLDAPPAL